MKSSIALLLACGLIFAAFVVHADDKTDLQLMQGSWILVAMESDSRNVPEDTVKQMGMVLTIKDKTMTTTQGDKSETVSFVIRSRTKPKEIDTVDAKGTNKDQPNLGVYSVDTDNNLKLCLRNGGKSRPTGFNTRKKSGDVTLIMRRQGT
jgi:uncharacterized protein (TIGR03067 family)